MRDAESLRFDDVVTFLTVHNTRSISAAARQLQVTPSQVSKAVARLEEFVGAQLLARGSRGVAVSIAGLRAIPMLEEIARGVRDLRTRPDATAMVRVAAPSSICSAVAGVLARTAPLVHTDRASMRFSCLELDPVRTRALAFEDVFDVALLADERSLGELYSHERVGEAESCLFARPALATRLGPQPISPDTLRDVPFVMPLVLQDTRVIGGKDLCPLAFEHRTQGHAAATFGAALELATSSDQLVFGPRVAAQGQVARGELLSIDVEGWGAIKWTIYLACHTTRVQAKTARALKAIIARWLEDSAAAEDGDLIPSKSDNARQAP
jgi:DNA-binding transcriptional LysR family regulator